MSGGARSADVEVGHVHQRAIDCTRGVVDGEQLQRELDYQETPCAADMSRCVPTGVTSYRSVAVQWR